VSRNDRQQSGNYQGRRECCGAKGAHESRQGFRIYATRLCTGRLSRAGGDESATGQGDTSCNIKSSSARCQVGRYADDGWTCQDTRHSWTMASSRTSLEGMASRHETHRWGGKQIDLTSKE
jgi:hypothetical protein